MTSRGILELDSILVAGLDGVVHDFDLTASRWGRDDLLGAFDVAVKRYSKECGGHPEAEHERTSAGYRAAIHKLVDLAGQGGDWSQEMDLCWDDVWSAVTEYASDVDGYTLLSTRLAKLRVEASILMTVTAVRGGRCP